MLIDRAHLASVPVYFIQHSTEKILVEGTDGWRFHPRLQPSESDRIIQKHHGSAFEKTTLQQELDELHIRQLVVTGLVTHGCVKAACLDAHRLGYEVVLVQDGHSNFNKDAQHVIEEWNRKLSQEVAILLPAREINFHEVSHANQELHPA